MPSRTPRRRGAASSATGALATTITALEAVVNPIYGDGSDGDVVIDGDSVSLPDPSAVPAWQTSYAYEVGDIVKSTDTHVRVYRCILGGVSDPGSESFPNQAPGEQRRGDRTARDGTETRWEQLTYIIDNVLEGPVFADDFTIAAGRTLQVHGWPIFVRGTATIEATAVLSSRGFDAEGGVPSTVQNWNNWEGIQTLVGRGVRGVGPGTSGIGGSTWGGGLGGSGGSGADDPSSVNSPGIKRGNDAVGFTLGRRSLFTMFSPFFFGLNSIGDYGTVGSSGGGGCSDTGNGKLGGASGSAGSGFALLAKTLVHNGLIDASGGDGADGESGGDTGGGGGGGGGCVVLCYRSKTGSGTVDVSAGAPGVGQGTGTDAINGSSGDFVEFANA